MDAGLARSSLKLVGGDGERVAGGRYREEAWIGWSAGRQELVGYQDGSSGGGKRGGECLGIRGE